MKKDMKKLLGSIEKLKRGKVGDLIETRIGEFKENAKKPCSEIFKELCFCILTASFNAEKCIKIHMEIGDGFLTLPEPLLAERLRKQGYRYPNTRARYIAEARRFIHSLKDILESFRDINEAREWLVRNIKGVGYKEASHFLRNIGYTDIAIIDFHIINLLARHGLIEKPKTLTKKRYFEIENLLKEIAEKSSLNLAQLDLYLWYMETKKVLK